MTDIKYQKIGELLKYQPKSKIKAGDGQKIGKYPLFTSSNKLSKFIDRATFKDESLIFGSGGSASVHYYNKDFSTSTDCFVVIKDNENIDLKYIYYFLKSNIQILEAGFKGAGLKHISKKYISNIKIPLLPLSNQQKITSFLTRIEQLIQKREESILLLDKLINSTFLDMFGDPVLNPKGWDVEILDKFGDIITGNTPPRADEENYNENYIEWIKTDNIIEGKLFPTLAKEFLSEIGLMKGRSVKAEAIIVACIAGSINSIGNLSLVNRSIAFNQQINAVQPYDNINSKFLYYMLKNSKEYIQNQAGKGMKKIITKSVFQNILFPHPPKPLQDKFTSIVTQIEQTKEAYQTSLDELNNLFDSVAQKAFKGELDVSKITLLDKTTSQQELQVLDETKILELIKQGDFEAQDHVNENQSYDDIRTLVLELLDKKKIAQRFTDKQIVLEAI